MANGTDIEKVSMRLGAVVILSSTIVTIVFGLFSTFALNSDLKAHEEDDAKATMLLQDMRADIGYIKGQMDELNRSLRANKLKK